MIHKAIYPEIGPHSDSRFYRSLHYPVMPLTMTTAPMGKGQFCRKVLFDHGKLLKKKELKPSSHAQNGEKN